MDRKLEALHYHARSGRYLDVQSLVNDGVDPDGKDCYVRTALMVAAFRKQRAVVEELINSGADIQCCDRWGRTVLHHASMGGSADIVQCLVNKGVAIDKKDSDGRTALMAAVRWGHREVVELLIKLGADIHCCDNSRKTVLHHASRRKSVQIVQCLFKNGVAIDKKDSGGETPLHYSVQLGRIQIADCLLKAGADCNLENNEGESPFNTLLKQERPHIQTIKLCIEKGAYVKPTDYDRLLKDPSLKEALLQDAPLCTRAVINKFNNRDLNLLYKGLSSTQNLPPIDQLQIGNGSGMPLQVEQAVAHEIQAKGFCNVLKLAPLVLRILCVKSLLEKSK